ncbi:phosphatase PAP2 family protein [Taibaiella helva]|uniref:phosphatase PAP2 family protein n=1 Tax=Taibaiella helva TaxID=2301235 RepID=UPI000E5899C1|nr:phosphatase PAP2 family protein [Taibaiella helva]
MKTCIFFSYLLLLPLFLHAQTDTTDRKVYRMYLKYELPGSLAFMTGSFFGFKALDRASVMSESDVLKLNRADVNGFDRPVIDYNPAGFTKAEGRSDFFLNFSIASPVLLALDKRIRKDWLDLVTLYLVSHAVDNTLYFAAAFPVRRARPLTYNPDIPMSFRTGEARSNSFFSGHVSFSATSTFFLVKVFTDYHHIKGWQRVGLYTAAAIPPAMVGYYRMHAGKHFKTDVLLGLVIGGASGILVPELHRKWKEKQHQHLSLQPYFNPYGGATGLSMSYRF